MRTLRLMVALLACLGVWAEGKVGQPAPDFSGTDIFGKTHRLGDYKGRVVVLEAYNLDCPFCAHHYRGGAMPGLQAAVTGKGAIWLVVNSTSAGNPSYRKPEAARKEFAELGMRATAWLDDHTGQIGKLYGMQTTPHVFVIDHQGVLVYQGAIDDRPERSGDPRTARNYVRLAVEALLASKPVPVAETKPYGSPIKYGN